ncbi:MAG: amidohydrolase family protein [Candidatus Hydrothermarchaeota archaeon]
MNDLVVMGNVLTPYEIIKDGAIGISGDRIVEIGKIGEIKGEEKIGGENKIVMPGLINTHTHLSMTLLRGIADDMPLMDWLQREIWPREAKLTGKHCYHGALLGCLEMLKSGTTCFADMYFFMDDVAKAVKESGIRAALSYGILEIDEETGKKMFNSAKKFVKKWKKSERIIPMFGPHTPYTCSEEMLVRVRKAASKEKVGIHIHLNETKEEVEKIKKEKGKYPIEYLNDIGFLGPDVLAAHCVWLNNEEVNILKEKDVKISHNPISNMKLGSGISPVEKLIKKGITVSLGTDGVASNNTLDLFEEMKVCALLQKADSLDPTTMPVDTVIKMATSYGGKALKTNSGSIEIGKKADLIVIDPKIPRLTPMHSIKSHIVYATHGDDVEDVIVDGKVVMRGGEVLTLDEEEVIERAEEFARDLVSE